VISLRLGHALSGVSSLDESYAHVVVRS
jgi:hypothetical protein